ncbi:MAG: glutaminyl-peptide cyclotransferase [Chloroflexi bacterium]|nr:glutaminyl-peptide cyclotransferase [Chloroflexota bacterium]
MKRLPFRMLLLLAVLAAAALTGVLGPAAAQGGDPFGPVEMLVPEVIEVREHDLAAYTQGFLLHEGRLFESTGQYGASTVREVDPETGDVVRSIDVPEEYFGEGLERVGDRLIQLTWKENTAFVYDLETFEQIDTFTYEGEGWGLCSDGEYLFMSDGSPFLSIRDLETFEVVFEGMVTVQGQPVMNINELECVGDSIYANIWHTDYIIQIDRMNGVVTALIDASDLLTEEERAELGEQDVLNGIAYNPETDTFLITGKRWPKMFEVRFVPAEQ